jgi:hypothetical protein
LELAYEIAEPLNDESRPRVIGELLAGLLLDPELADLAEPQADTVAATVTMVAAASHAWCLLWCIRVLR